MSPAATQTLDNPHRLVLSAIGRRAQLPIAQTQAAATASHTCALLGPVHEHANHAQRRTYVALVHAHRNDASLRVIRQSANPRLPTVAPPTHPLSLTNDLRNSRGSCPSKCAALWAKHSLAGSLLVSQIQSPPAKTARAISRTEGTLGQELGEPLIAFCSSDESRRVKSCVQRLSGFARIRVDIKERPVGTKNPGSSDGPHQSDPAITLRFAIDVKRR
jgi:hypothetical protein